IDTELQAVLPCRSRHFANNIALSGFPRAFLHAVIRLLRGPEAEAIMMFRDEDDVSCTGGFDCRHPLLGIKFTGIKNPRIRRAISPFAVLKRVGSKMNDHTEFQILPFHLLRRRFDGGGNEWLGFGGVHFNGRWQGRPPDQPYTGKFDWQDDQVVDFLREKQPGIVINDRTDAPYGLTGERKITATGATRDEGNCFQYRG